MSRHKSRDENEHTELGSGTEFDLVRTLLAEWGTAAHGIGDDAALLQVPPNEKLVVSTDTSVDGVHFRREWVDHTEIGYRATVAALSDLAAMAARPLGALIALTLPEADRAQVKALAAGIKAAVTAARCPIIGGDLSSGTTLSLTITVLGSTARPLARSGASVGDRVYVTGALGGPGAAVRAWLSGGKPREADRARFAHPVPRIREALALAGLGATSAIDISDGLLADLAHVAAASGVGIEIDLERIPRVAGASAVDAASSGEEYELAVTASSLDARAFAADTGLPLTEIGRIVAGTGGGSVVLLDNGKQIATPAGYDHFRKK